MKTTPWRKPVGDCGGISYLIANHYIRKEQPDCASHIDVIVHAYREVGTSLEASIEVRYWYFKGDYKKVTNHIKFENITI